MKLITFSLECICASKKAFPQNPHVINGIAFSFGDEEGYYLPLPNRLPIVTSWNQYLFRNNRNIICKDENLSKLSRVSSSICQIICRFVGFQTIFDKCSYLKSKVLQYKRFDTTVTHGSDQYHTSKNDRISTHVMNPLLLVSKLWSTHCRFAMVEEWGKGKTNAVAFYRSINDL
jgi:hypothetical protein